MTVSAIAVTEGSGKNIWTDQRTVSSTAREAQFWLPAPMVYPTYSAIASGISIATSAAHVIFVQADGTNYTRLTRIRCAVTDDIPAAATMGLFEIYRTSTAGSGGGAVTAAPYDTADSYAGTIQTLPSSKGTEAAKVYQLRLPFPAAQPANPVHVEWVAQDRTKEIVFGSGTGAGIAVKINTGIASCTVDVLLEFYVTSYL